MRHRILGRTLAEPVHPAHPVGHQVRPVRSQPGQLGHQLIRGGDRSQVPAHPGDVSDDPGVLGVGLALAAERPGQAGNHPAGDVDHVLAAGQQHCQQQRCHRADQIHRPPHLAARPACPGDQLDPPLLIGDPHRPQQPAISVNRPQRGGWPSRHPHQPRPHHEPSPGPPSHQRWSAPWAAPPAGP
jgi:hypothetical protein